jgi:hypothetical protein
MTEFNKDGIKKILDKKPKMCFNVVKRLGRTQ